METIFIYGIVAVIVLTGIGALVYFGVLDLGSYLPETCKCTESGLECTEWNLPSGSGNIVLGIENQLNAGIEVSEFTVSAPSGVQYLNNGSLTTSCTSAPDGNAVGTNNATIGPKQIGEIKSNCYVAGDYSGERIKLAYTMTYERSDGAIQQTANGEVSAVVS